MLELPPLGLYIHIPWCIKKCPYCDFNSHQTGGVLDEQAYLDALLHDLELDRGLIQSRSISSIFIGGGTPSLLSQHFYTSLIHSIRGMINLAEDLEITLEANPGTAESERFSGYRQAGINRLSLGIQSFDDLQLQALGRIHDSAEARRSIEIARTAGFDNFNLDLMFGLPGQSHKAALGDLKSAVILEPEHLSWYQLTIEPNTEFYSNPPTLPEENETLQMLIRGYELLKSAGYQQYETSAWSREHRQCRHNLNYWHFGDYLGIGAGAHGKITLPEKNHVVRTRKTRQPKSYLAVKGNYIAQTQILQKEDLKIEFLMNALRLTDGFEISLFNQRTGNSFSAIEKSLEYLFEQNMLKQVKEKVVPTSRGQLLLNSMLEAFL